MKSEPLSRALTLDQRDKACELYREGLTISEVANFFGVHASSIGKLLKSRDIPRPPPPNVFMHSEGEQAAICQEYLDGKSAGRIAKERDACTTTITNALKRGGVTRRSASERNRTYDCDHRFFDNIDSQEKAYWLGFFAADGCIGRPKRGQSAELILSLGIRDREHLALFKEVLQSQHPIREYDYSGSGRTNYPYVSFSVRSKQLTTALARLGVVSAKCHTFQWPDLARALRRHFLRGYFDGDGYWNIKYLYKNDQKMTHRRPDLEFRLTSDQRFLEGCRAYLEGACDLSRTKLSHRYWKGEYSASTLIFAGRSNCRRIFHLMYDGASVYLSRKKEKAEPHVL